MLHGGPLDGATLPAARGRYVAVDAVDRSGATLRYIPDATTIGMLHAHYGGRAAQAGR
jgi:hypothetical protein